MSVPISSFATNQVQSTARLTPVGRASAAALRADQRDVDAIVHLSDQARAILAGTLPESEVTVVPAREPADEQTSDDVQEVEAEPLFGQHPPESDEATALPGSSRPRSPEQERAIQQLQARDVEVRAHEAAHAAVAGSLGGRPSLEYVVGPDGKRYAVGGEVSVDTSPGRTPEETITKARIIRAAATAPANPSAQDMAVAASAARMESQAQSAIRERKQGESRGRAEHISAESVSPGSIRRIDWSTIGRANRTEAANDITAVAESAAPKSAPAAIESPAVSDTEMMMLQLVREQISARGGMGHAHLSSGCGFCRRAAANYAYA